MLAGHRDLAHIMDRCAMNQARHLVSAKSASIRSINTICPPLPRLKWRAGKQQDMPAAPRPVADLLKPLPPRVRCQMIVPKLDAAAPRQCLYRPVSTFIIRRIGHQPDFRADLPDDLRLRIGKPGLVNRIYLPYSRPIANWNVI